MALRFTAPNAGRDRSIVPTTVHGHDLSEPAMDREQESREKLTQASSALDTPRRNIVEDAVVAGADE
jgi:hypothetical protein